MYFSFNGLSDRPDFSSWLPIDQYRSAYVLVFTVFAFTAKCSSCCYCFAFTGL